MNNQMLIEKMKVKRNKTEIIPLDVICLKGKYLVAIYKGKKSKDDFIIKYRQKINEKWTSIRTPKHIHFAIDILIKLYSDEETTLQFLDFLLDYWNNSSPIDIDKLKLNDLINNEEIKKFEKMNKIGEYDIEFLMLLGKLLILQERTNYPNGKLFPKLLKKLRERDIFSVVSMATFNNK